MKKKIKLISSTIIENMKGAPHGIPELDELGKVPAPQLPSYVDDVEGYDSVNDFPKVGESGKIYIDRTYGICYRWDGETYAGVASHLELGETETRAYPGNKGKANAEAIAKKAEKDGTNASGTWGIDITGKAVKDGSGNEITKTYLPLAGGTMNKDGSIKATSSKDTRYTVYGEHGSNLYYPSDSAFVMGDTFYNQKGEELGSIGLFGQVNNPSYYFIGKYSDPFVKVDMEGNTTIKKT